MHDPRPLQSQPAQVPNHEREAGQLGQHDPHCLRGSNEPRRLHARLHPAVRLFAELGPKREQDLFEPVQPAAGAARLHSIRREVPRGDHHAPEHFPELRELDEHHEVREQPPEPLRLPGPGVCSRRLPVRVILRIRSAQRRRPLHADLRLLRPHLLHHRLRHLAARRRLPPSSQQRPQQHPLRYVPCRKPAESGQTSAGQVLLEEAIVLQQAAAPHVQVPPCRLHLHILLLRPLQLPLHASGLFHLLVVSL